MLNWQCFRCSNIAQTGLRHEILIIQFASIFSGCQSHFAKKKEKKNKKAQHQKQTTFHGKGNRNWQLVPCDTVYLKEHLTVSADL